MTVSTEGTVHAPTEGKTVKDSASAMWDRLSECSPYSGRPASIRDVVSYTRAGGWVPGEHEWYWELPGYLYGYLIAIPVTVGLYGVSWVLQRPGRLAVVALVIGLLWLASR
jgi:hypothetical protein